MWFKNLRIYRLIHMPTLNGEVINAESLNDALEDSAFVPCNSQDLSRYGWVSPLTGHGDGDESLVHANQEFLMVCAKKQEKVLPAAVVNEAVAEKVASITEEEGRPVSRKERADIKDDVTMTLLPRAFTRSSLQFAYIALQQGYIVINAASAAKAEELLSSLRDVLGRLSVVPLLSKQLPHQGMTEWLTSAAAPLPFVLGDECELSDEKEAGSVIRCKHQDLAAEEIHQLLISGMIVTKLGLQWREGVSFVLDDQLAIKRLRFEDNIQEKADGLEAQDEHEKFDIEFSVMTLELTAFIRDLVEALGGMDMNAPSVDEIVAQATKDDASTMRSTGVDELV